MKPIETPEGKLIRALCGQIEKSRADLASGNKTGALIELEYAQVIVVDSFLQYPELKGVFYK